MIRYVDDEVVQQPARDRTRRLMLSSTWALVAAFVVGAPAAYVASVELGPIGYTAQGTIWMARGPRLSFYDGSTPSRPSPFVSDDCMSPLCSPQVLTPVVLDHRLFLDVPDVHAEAFATFSVDERQLVPGSYQLEVGGHTGDEYILRDENGQLVQTGALGSRVGERLGFRWAPPSDAFVRGAVVAFSLSSPSDAALELSRRLVTKAEAQEAVFSVSLTGPDAREVADVVNAVMRRYVEVANEAIGHELSHASDSRLSELLALRDRLQRAKSVEWHVVTCSFGLTGEDGPAIDPNQATQVSEEERRLQIEELRDRGEELMPGARILEEASVPDRRDEEDRLPLLVLTFLGCFGLALAGALRLSRTRVMEGGEI